jgi:hypothetical protein
MGGIRNVYKILVGSLKGRDHSEHLGADGKIILKWILGKWRCRVWIRRICFRIETGGGFL